MAGVGLLLAIWWLLPRLNRGLDSDNSTLEATSSQNRLSQLLLLYPTNGPANLYLIEPASGISQTLTTANQGVLDYTVQSDGQAVFFTQRHGNSGSTIYKLRLDDIQTRLKGSDAVQPSAIPSPEVVYECEQAICQSLSIDPQNSHLAFERSSLPGSGRNENPQIWVLPLINGNEGNAFSAGNPEHQTEQPSWSSKGLLGFYDVSDAAYVFSDSAGKEVGRFPNQVGEGGIWHPDGNAFLAPEISYVLGSQNSPELSNLVSLADSHLILHHLDTKRSEDLTPGHGVEDASPAFSRRGDFLVFGRKYLDAKQWTPGRQIWIANTESREARALTEEPLYNHFDFSWSPYGDQLAYMRFDQSAMTEPPEIWIYDLLSGESRQLLVGGYQPQWLP